MSASRDNTARHCCAFLFKAQPGWVYLAAIAKQLVFSPLLLCPVIAAIFLCLSLIRNSFLQIQGQPSCAPEIFRVIAWVLSTTCSGSKTGKSLSVSSPTSSLSHCLRTSCRPPEISLPPVRRVSRPLPLFPVVVASPPPGAVFVQHRLVSPGTLIIGLMFIIQIPNQPSLTSLV